MCIVEFFLNQELQISNPCGRQHQQQQHPACAGMTVAVQRIIHCHVQDREEPFASLTTKSGVNIARDLFLIKTNCAVGIE